MVCILVALCVGCPALGLGTPRGFRVKHEAIKSVRESSINQYCIIMEEKKCIQMNLHKKYLYLLINSDRQISYILKCSQYITRFSCLDYSHHAISKESNK